MKPKTTFLFFSIIILIASCGSNKKWIELNFSEKDGLHDIEAVNDNLAYAYSYGTGKFLKSKNGRDWEKVYQFDSIYFEQIQFFDEKNGWICGSPNKIYKTENGGKTWEDKHIKNAFKKGLIYGMYFQNMETGFVALIDFSNGMKSEIYKTENGGDDWKLVNTINDGILNLENINGELYGSGRNVIYKNIDVPEKSGQVYKDDSKKVGDIRDLAIDESGKIMAIGFNGYVIRNDNGKWEPQKITENRLRSIASLGGSKWLVVGDANKEKGHVFRSDDNGKNWTMISSEWPDIHRIDVSGKKIWLVGKDGFSVIKKK